jgi:transcriptional regulator with XRE-family HTH domain
MKKLDQKQFNIQLGTIVKKLREERELSRINLAQISSVNEKYIGKIERGDTSPSCFVLKKLSLGLKTELTEIIKSL